MSGSHRWDAGEGSFPVFACARWMTKQSRVQGKKMKNKIKIKMKLKRDMASSNAKLEQWES